MRNILEYMRMIKGTPIPVKTTSTIVFTELGRYKVVVSDASNFFDSEKFDELLLKSNPKLLWQVLENLKYGDIYSPISVRQVQGVTVTYSVPIPEVDIYLSEIVQQKIKKALKILLRSRNTESVYVDAENYRLQYSGRKSTELSFSGEFLSPGSEFDIPDKRYMRLGVLWRGEKSVDLDHNVKVGNTDVYYAKPTMDVRGNIAATSSGDITSCSKEVFSCEFVDLDMQMLLAHNITDIYNSLIVFHGRTTLGELEAYFFCTFIDERQAGSKVSIDLSKADYAIRIDPDNVDKTGSYIGLSFDLKIGKAKTLCFPIKSDGCYSNVKSTATEFSRALKDANEHISVEYAVKKAFKNKVEVDKADIVISAKTREELKLKDEQTLIHPGREMELITSKLFLS